MADFTLTNVARYPNSTEVKAYPESNWPNSMVKTDAAPIGSATSTKTMTNGTLTFTGLTAGTRYVAHAEVADEDRYTAFIAGEDISASSDVARQSVIDARYREVQTASVRASAASVTGAGVYVIQTNGAMAAQDQANLSATLIYIDPAKYAINGRSTKLRMVAACGVTDTAPAMTLTVGLYPVTNISGAASAVDPNYGTVVSGSTIAFASPAANSESAEQATADFDLPAEGWYGLGVAASGAMAANSTVLMPLRLEVRNVVP